MSMDNLHIEVITPTGVRHLAEITMFRVEQSLIDALNQQLIAHGQRWFPADTHPYTMRDAWLTVSDHNATFDGYTDEATAARWLREGISFFTGFGASQISNPDIQRVLVMSYAELLAMDDAIDQDCATLSGVLGLMRAWHERPEVVTVRIVAW